MGACVGNGSVMTCTLTNLLTAASEVVQFNGFTGSSATLNGQQFVVQTRSSSQFTVNSTFNGTSAGAATVVPVPSCTEAGTLPSFSTSGGTTTSGTCSDTDFGVGTTTLPKASPFSMAAAYAGVSNLTAYGNTNAAGNAGSNFLKNLCAYCWITGVAGSFTPADHVDVQWSYFGEVTNSYFSNSFLHTPGSYDSNIDLLYNTSGELVQNNILERLHTSLMIENGAAGNVLAYNYSFGAYDNEVIPPSFVIGDISEHGALTQFNLFEGNDATALNWDSGWGSNSENTTFRNRLRGTTIQCPPYSYATGSRGGTVTCSPAIWNSSNINSTGYYAYYESSGGLLGYLTTNGNFIGDVTGSTAQSTQTCKNGGIPNGTGSCIGGNGLLPLVDTVISVCPSGITTNCGPDSKDYGNQGTSWAWGYGSSSDQGGNEPYESSVPYSTRVFTSEYSNITGTTTNPATMPASFYLSAQPSWWPNTIPYPAIGSDVTGGNGPGGHAYALPRSIVMSTTWVEARRCPALVVR